MNIFFWLKRNQRIINFDNYFECILRVAISSLKVCNSLDHSLSLGHFISLYPPNYSNKPHTLLSVHSERPQLSVVLSSTGSVTLVREMTFFLLAHLDIAFIFSQSRSGSLFCPNMYKLDQRKFSYVCEDSLGRCSQYRKFPFLQNVPWT